MPLYHLLKNKTKLARKRFRHRFKIFFSHHWRRARKEPVFILTVRRTGSNLLLDYLNSIPNVSFLPEILNKDMFYGVRDRCISKASVLRHLSHSIDHCAHTICGAKLLKLHLETHRVTVEDLKKIFPQARFIILYRQSLMDQFVSLKIAESTGQWQSATHRRLNPPIPVDVKELKEYCENTRRFYEELLEHPWLEDRSLVLSYEELAAHPQKIFDEKVFPFLDLPSSRVTCRIKKQNTRRLSQTVMNYGQIEPLVDSPWLWQSYSPVQEKEAALSSWR